MHLGLILALVAAVVDLAVLSRTRWGYEIRVIGENPPAARYAGISVVRNMLLVMLLSGGLAGIAGMAEVAGISHRLQKGLTVGYGFTAIIVAWLARAAIPGACCWSPCSWPGCWSAAIRFRSPWDCRRRWR